MQLSAHHHAQSSYDTFRTSTVTGSSAAAEVLLQKECWIVLHGRCYLRQGGCLRQLWIQTSGLVPVIHTEMMKPEITCSIYNYHQTTLGTVRSERSRQLENWQPLIHHLFFIGGEGGNISKDHGDGDDRNWGSLLNELSLLVWEHSAGHRGLMTIPPSGIYVPPTGYLVNCDISAQQSAYPASSYERFQADDLFVLDPKPMELARLQMFTPLASH